MKLALLLSLCAFLVVVGFQGGRLLGRASAVSREDSSQGLTEAAPSGFRTSASVPPVQPDNVRSLTLAEALQTEHPLYRIAQLSDAVSGMTLPEVEAAIETLISARPTSVGDEALPLLWKRYGELAGFRAVERSYAIALEMNEVPGVEQTAVGWFELEPDAAWTWALEKRRSASTSSNTPSYTVARSYFFSLVRSIAQGPRSEWLVSEVLSMTDSKVQAEVAGQIGFASGQTDPGSLVILSEQLPAGEARTGMLSGFAAAFAREDPLAAAEWALTLNTAERSRVLRSAVSGWNFVGRSADVTDWLVNQPSNDAVDSALRSHFLMMAFNAKTDAIQQLEEITDSAKKEIALQAIVASLRSRDPGEAFTFAERLQESRERSRNLYPLFQQWHSTDPAAAERYISGSPHLTDEERSALLQAATGPNLRR